MRTIAIGLALAVLLVNSSSANACEGRDVVFEDKFQSNEGGWSQKPSVAVADGALTFTLSADDMQSNLNVMFSARDADICAEAVWPYEDESRTQILGAGLLFWGLDNRTYYQFGILNNGRYWIARKQNGVWVGTIAANIDSPAIQTAPGSSNTLRVDAKGNTLSFYINGTKVRVVRGQAPKSDWRFGVSGDNFDKENDATLLFTNMKVTD